ncbi:MAG: alpha/beta fold hydrolase [Spirochaetes bacterium]|nr:alpha/beta fold hydrolase [Spirochaetota bacterium]
MKRSEIKKILKRLLIILIIIIALMLINILYQAFESNRIFKEYPPPGKLVHIGQHNLHIWCMGKGEPAVILEAGIGGNALSMYMIQKGLSGSTKVCSYDRAGYGWSDDCPGDRTCDQIISELYTLLKKAGVKGPYILVGHSLGGFNVRMFAQKYPSLVKGIVLLDAAHPVQFSDLKEPMEFPLVLKKRQMQMYAIMPWLSGTGLLKIFYSLGLLGPVGRFFGIPDDVPERYKKAYQGLVLNPRHWRTAKREIDFLCREKASQAQKKNILGKIPLVVISADTGVGLPDNMTQEEFKQIWLTLQKDMTRLSSNSRQFILKGADHFSILVAPEYTRKVIDIIQQMIDQR